MFRCEFCGSRVAYAELDRHKQSAHPEAYAAVETADAETKKVYRKIIWPGVTVWISTFLYALLVGKWWMSSWWAAVLIALFLVPVGLLVPVFFSARRQWRPAYSAIALVQMACYICDASLVRRDFLQHLALLHPVAARRARMMRYLTGLLLVVLFGAFTVVGLVGAATPGGGTAAALLATMVLLFAALCGLIVFMGYLGRRFEKVDRQVWWGPRV